MSPGNRGVDRWIAKYNKQRSEETMAKSDKAPSSSGEHEAVRRLQDELARGEALTEAIATGASLPPASPIPRTDPPDETPVTLPPLAEREPDPLGTALAELRAYVRSNGHLTRAWLAVFESLLERVEAAARRRRSPPAF